MDSFKTNIRPSAFTKYESPTVQINQGNRPFRTLLDAASATPVAPLSSAPSITPSTSVGPTAFPNGFVANVDVSSSPSMTSRKPSSSQLQQQQQQPSSSSSYIPPLQAGSSMFISPAFGNVPAPPLLQPLTTPPTTNNSTTTTTTNSLLRPQQPPTSGVNDHSMMMPGMMFPYPPQNFSFFDPQQMMNRQKQLEKRLEEQVKHQDALQQQVFFLQEMLLKLQSNQTMIKPEPLMWQPPLAATPLIFPGSFTQTPTTTKPIKYKLPDDAFPAKRHHRGLSEGEEPLLLSLDTLSPAVNKESKPKKKKDDDEDYLFNGDEYVDADHSDADFDSAMRPDDIKTALDSTVVAANGEVDPLWLYQHDLGRFKGPRKVIPRKCKEVLIEWLREHRADPYPSEMDKAKLADKTGLSLAQVGNWFINARRRYLPEFQVQKKALMEGLRLRTMQSEGPPPF